MGIETNLNQSPYFDDFNETKNFHRVLFRPGYAVQARELNQLQNILQNQIERFADEVLVDGTVISGVGLRPETLNYVKLRDKDANNRVLLISDFYENGVVANAVVTGATTGMTAQLINVAEGSEAASPNYLTLFVQYTNSGANNTTKEFSDNEVLLVRRRSNNGFLVAANTISSSSTGKNLGIAVTDGIVYHKGNFIRVSPQRVVVDKYSTTPTKRVGFETRETIVDSNQDSSLLDNASGATNYSAPGANRLKLNPVLVVRSSNVDISNTTTFFTIANIEEGNIQAKYTDTLYSDIGKNMARRSFETSGNYAITPFNIRVREHLRNDTNYGKYFSGAGGIGDINKLIAEVEPGIAYVDGNRVEILATTTKPFDKATDYEVKDARIVGQTIGNYVNARQVVGSWGFQSLAAVDLRSAAASAITATTHATTAAAGSSIGSAKVRGIQWDSGTAGTPSGRFRIYLFDVQMNAGYSFADVRGLYIADSMGSGNHAHADIILETNGTAQIQETGLASLVFPFTQRATKTLKDKDNNVDTQFVFRQSTDVSIATTGTGTLSKPATHTGGTESLNDTGTLSDADKRNFVIISKTATTTDEHTGYVTGYGGNTVTGSGTSFTTAYKEGDVIQITHGANTYNEIVSSVTNNTELKVFGTARFEGDTSSGQTLAHRTSFPIGKVWDLSSNGSIIGSTSSAAIDLQVANLTSTFTATVSYDVLRSTAVQTSKVVNKNKFVRINTGSHSASSTGPWPLGVSDAYKLVAVYKGSNTGVTTSDTDVTSDFELDSGMRDGFYDTAYLKKKSTSTLSTSNVGLIAKFNYFGRDRSSGIGFLSVDSYPIDDTNTSNTAAITTQEIPVYTSTRTGLVYDLRDSIDYRPYKANTAAPTGVYSTAPTNPTAATTFDVDSDGVYSPTPDQNFQADVQFYLGRKDKVTLSPTATIEVVKGVPAVTPKSPDEKTGAMTLAVLDIPPYPSLSALVAKQYNRLDYQVRLNVENNRRYTMKDLRAIDQRVKTLEYYSSLNALEASIKNKQLFSDTGIDRFKNGFLVDNFDGHNVADVTNPAYRAAIDKYSTLLRPSYSQYYVDMQQSTSLSSSNVTKTGDLITLSYTNKKHLEQPFASKQRNCVQELMFNWKGEVILNPSIDNQPDITELPEIQIDFGGMYDAIEQIAQRTGFLGTDWGNWTTSSTTVTNTGAAIGTTTNQIRQGLQTTISPSIENFSFGNLVQDVAIRDYMKSRLVEFTGVRMKPSTRVYPYFDDELVSGYCTPANSSFSNTAPEGSPLVTDASGNVYGVFRIPNDERLKFRIGTRRFELKDIANTQTQSSLISTSAHADYTSIKLDVVTVGASVNLKTPQFNTEVRTQTSSTTTWIPLGNDGGDSGGNDPLSQTYTISTPTNSDGVFVTKVDLYFAKKSSTLPVTLQIREVVNGTPTREIVPYGTKTLQASEVTANSIVATNATSFTFDSPVFLKNNTDYGFIVMPGGNSDEYAVWCAELGGIDVDRNQLIHKQPASGILFSSANDRTWTPIQAEDMKYTIHVAQFSQSPGTVYFENKFTDYLSVDNYSGNSFRAGEKVIAESVLTFANNSTVSVGQIVQSFAAKNGTTGSNFANGVIRQIVTSGSGSVTVKVDNYGLFPTSATSNTNNLYIGTTWVGNTSAFSGNSVSGFVSFSDVTNRVLHLTPSTGSFANGWIRGQKSGASARVTTVDNLQMNAVVPKLPQLVYSNTNLSWTMRTTSDGGVISPTYVNVNMGVDNEIIDGEKKVYGYTNQTALSAVDSSKSTLVYKGVMSTTDPYVSPVVDTTRTTSIVLGNLINNDSAGETTEIGNALVRYISKPVVLEDGQEAEDLVVYLTAYKPQTTDLKVYARLLNGEDGDSFTDKDYTLLRQVTAANTYSDSVDRGDFKEFEYTFSANSNGDNFLNSNSDNQAKLNTSNNNVVAYRSSSGSIYHSYKTFAIKIVMTSSGTELIPLVRDMRAIALQR